MNDVNEVVDGYIAMWNEPDPARRRELIARTWSTEARYVDPMQSGEGREGIDGMVAAVQERFPGFRFRRAGKLDGHNQHVRFGWELVGPDGGAPVVAGVDFGVLADDGRLRTIVGFLDQVPGQQPAA